MKYNINKEELIQKYVNENLTINQCAEYFGCSRHPIEDRISKYNIHKTLSHQTIMEMTDKMYDVLRGAMLGDGSLLIRKRCVNAYFSYTSKSLQHIRFVGQYFENYKSGKGYFTGERYDNRTQKCYQYNSFITNNSVTLTEEMNKWYIDGIKHIPKDLVLTPLMCLVWYLGDGGLNNNPKSNAQTIQLATNCFEKDEIETILLPQLSQFDARICKNGIGKNDQKQHYQIKIYRKENIERFLKYIGSCPFDDYAYKWNIKPSLLPNYQQYANEWIELYKLNFATTKIALLYNTSHSTVSHILSNNHVVVTDARNRGLFPPCMEWETLYSNGKTFNDIARIFNCSAEIIERYFNYIEINGNEEFMYSKYKNRITQKCNII